MQKKTLIWLAGHCILQLISWANLITAVSTIQTCATVHACWQSTSSYIVKLYRMVCHCILQLISSNQGGNWKRNKREFTWINKTRKARSWKITFGEELEIRKLMWLQKISLKREAVQSFWWHDDQLQFIIKSPPLWKASKPHNSCTF